MPRTLKGKGWLLMPNPDFTEEVKRSTELGKILEADAKAGAEAYRDSVPVDEGDLRDSIFGEAKLTSEGYVGRIAATDWKAALVEFGTRDLEPDGSLRRAVEAIGYDVEERDER